MDPRYPIGKFERPAAYSPGLRKEWIDTLAAAPARFDAAVRGLSDEQLDTPYRDGGWTLRQVVHHVADSHMTSFIRFRLALTEDQPTVKPYDENRWAVLPDATLPIVPSLEIIHGVHVRLVALLEGIPEADFRRTFIHPDMGAFEIQTNLALYAWHSRHHEGHITSLRDRMGWK